MEIKTEHSLGDKLWRVRDSKANCFEVRCIVYDGTVYYGETCYELTLSTQCFATKEGLLKYVADNGEEDL